MLLLTHSQPKFCSYPSMCLSLLYIFTLCSIAKLQNKKYSRSPTTPTWHEDDSHSMAAPRASSSYLDTNGGDTSSHIMDQSSVVSMKSGGGHDRVHSLSISNPLNNNVSNNDTDSVNGPNEKSEMDGAQIENDAKSISSNKSVGSAQDR